MIRRTILLLGCSQTLLGACAGPAPATAPAVPPAPAASMARATTTSAAPAAPPSSVALAADTPESTIEGATFTAPAKWTVAARGPRVLLTGPEPDLRIAVADAPHGISPEDAVAAAWNSVRPGFKRTLHLAQTLPPRHGWDEQRYYDYETSPDEKMVVFADAFRHGDSWAVVTFECGRASFEKRNSQVLLVANSLRPRGYTMESFAGKTPHALDRARIQQIIGTIEKGRVRAGIPGVALALLQDGKVVYEGGLGTRDLGKPDKVDPRTLFMIASNTKAMTTLLLAKLVDEGKLGWDTPVASIDPEFKLGDDATTRQVLVRHLVCACTGLPRQDLEWLLEYGHSTPASCMKLLGTMQPTTKFGETFQYSNLMAAAAGYVAGHVLLPGKERGAAYDEAMQTRVFGPLGMTDTTFDYSGAMKRDHATGYGPDPDGKLDVVLDVNRAAIPVRPAGEAWSSVHDIAKFIAMELARGKLPGGKQLVSEEALLERRKPQVRIGEFATYGMGLGVDTEFGVPVVQHGGALSGYYSQMFWLPDQGVGGVILTNAWPGWLFGHAFVRRTLEVLFDGHAEADDDLASAIAMYEADRSKERARLTIPPDPDATARLARHYVSPALGELTVIADGPARTFDFGEWKSPVASRRNDDGTTSFITVGHGVDGWLDLVPAERDGKRALVVRDMQHEYAFVEAP